MDAMDTTVRAEVPEPRAMAQLVTAACCCPECCADDQGGTGETACC